MDNRMHPVRAAVRLVLYSVVSMVMLAYILAVKGRRQYIASSLVLRQSGLATAADRPAGVAQVSARR